ncbi:MAG: aldo/keto reductase [Coprobacillaceae bacterium]
MEFVTLNNGIKIPKAGFGVFQIRDKEECIQCVHNAIKAGYRLIDTAQSYGNEEAVGEAINTCGVAREELFITTKVWISNAGYEKAKASILESLEKLQLDYLDLMLIHQPLSDYYGTYKAMEELYKEGKIKAIGVSNFYPDRLTDIAMFSEIVPQVNQVEVNPFQQQIEAQQNMEKHNVQIQAWAPFAEGKNDMFNNPTLKAIGDKHNKSIAQVILRWLSQRNVVSLAKSSSIERMKENINIFDFELTKEEMEVIAGLDKKESSFFNHQDPDAVERLANLVR